MNSVEPVAICITELKENMLCLELLWAKDAAFFWSALLFNRLFIEDHKFITQQSRYVCMPAYECTEQDSKDVFKTSVRDSTD